MKLLSNTEQNQHKGMMRTLIWKRPIALWILPAVFLFITTIVPLSGNHNYFYTPTLSHGVLLFVMSFIITHQYFSFMHRIPASDFYYALPVNRTKLFCGLNLGAIAYLIGPSLVMALLHSSLMGILNIYAHHVRGFTDYWLVFISLFVKTLIFFFMMQIFYLITEKTSSAITMFLLVNAFWPLIVLLFTDATASFLPGFIAPTMTSPNTISLWTLNIIQILSPASAFFLNPDVTFSWFSLALLGVTIVIAWWLFRNRQAENSRQSGRFNWPFTITQWMVVLAISLLGGYAGHYLRIITSQALVQETTLAESTTLSPLPFLIGMGLGLILSLWAFNLFQGKGRMKWKALVLPAVTSIVPLAIWLAIVITGAFGFSTKAPQASDVANVTITYNTSRAKYDHYPGDFPVKVTLTDEHDIDNFMKLFGQTISSQHPGLSVPRTLSSNQLLHKFVQEQRIAMGTDVYNNFYEDTTFSITLKNGSKMNRRLPLIEIPQNDFFSDLMMRNKDYMLAQLSFKQILKEEYDFDKDGFSKHYSLEIIANPNIPASSLPKWVTTLKERLEDPDSPDLNVANSLRSLIANHLLKLSDEKRAEYAEKAPCTLRMTLKQNTFKGITEPITIDYPVYPEKVESLAEVLKRFS